MPRVESKCGPAARERHLDLRVSWRRKTFNNQKYFLPTHYRRLVSWMPYSFIYVTLS